MNLAIAAIVVVGWSVMGASLEAAKVITAPAYWALYGAVGVELAAWLCVKLSSNVVPNKRGQRAAQNDGAATT